MKRHADRNHGVVCRFPKGGFRVLYIAYVALVLVRGVRTHATLHE